MYPRLRAHWLQRRTTRDLYFGARRARNTIDFRATLIFYLVVEQYYVESVTYSLIIRPTQRCTPSRQNLPQWALEYQKSMKMQEERRSFEGAPIESGVRGPGGAILRGTSCWWCGSATRAQAHRAQPQTAPRVKESSL
jgi:hypothetical protein